jgi:hypothetical protein
MDYDRHCSGKPSENSLHRRVVAYVGVDMLIFEAMLPAQALAIPVSARSITKEMPPQIVVDAYHV